MISRFVNLALPASAVWTASVSAINNQVPLAPIAEFDKSACPNYANYATFMQRLASGRLLNTFTASATNFFVSMPSSQPLSEGPLALPFQRPDEKCRTFTADSIEQVIKDVTTRMKDPDMARLFENAFPSTTDTTVKFHTDGKDATFMAMVQNSLQFDVGDKGKWEGPQSFVITGDIIAEWLRDSTNQLRPYQPLAKKDKKVFTLILGAINTQLEYVIESPYCNAFQPPPISNLAPSHNGQHDVVNPIYEPSVVFECKYELDSLAHFVALSNDFYEHTGSQDHLGSRWYKALDTILDVLEAQSQPTFNPKTQQFVRNTYTFQRKTDTGTETLNLRGIGNPLNFGTGLVRSAFRPSDDATILGFLIPSNAMMGAELKRTASMLTSAGKTELADKISAWSKKLIDGVWEHGVVKHKKYGDVFAYEVDGYGSNIMMDDANYPSLLALPLMGFCNEDDPVYVNTRKMILEKAGNPYYLEGRQFKGIGGPHIGPQNAWPMSLLIQAQTSSNDEEIKECLSLVLNSSKRGLIHESVDVNHASSYTRSWFAWANGVFANTILDLAKRKPYLIFKENVPYEI
ncbi:Histone acetyltransferase ESA1 [Ceratocystis lukuohia]|uniref:Histone acetyltransferase ESA1 n=1 Tax=Ceratocystis lukuohia TaxID=2019550 RepID=A0ABR4MBM6_9PEZI